MQAITLPKNIKVKIYVRSNSWDAYLTAVDEHGQKIAVSINPENFIGAEDTTWQEYRDDFIETGDDVQVFHL